MLWRALFDGLQIDADEAAVRAHAAELVLRRARIQALELRALAIRGVDIDMKVGLADGHVWRGGETQSASGIPFLPALPSDALFTAPAARHGEGAIAFSRPIAIAGDIVTDLSARFLAGEVTEITARSGKDGFERLLNSAAGARRLGKIALVERTAPFARQALHFLNPMMDGASAPHIAFGTPLSSTLHDGAGANQSTLHIDAIFDGADIAVDGVDSTGRANALMREGLFVI
jgi:aminopeptidase